MGRALRHRSDEGRDTEKGDRERYTCSIHTEGRRKGENRTCRYTHQHAHPSQLHNSEDVYNTPLIKTSPNEQVCIMYTSVCVREYTHFPTELGGESVLNRRVTLQKTSLYVLQMCCLCVGVVSLCFMVKETNIHTLCTHILVWFFHESMYRNPLRKNPLV